MGEVIGGVLAAMAECYPSRDKQDHKRDLSWYPLETALLEGKVDAIYTQSNQMQHVQEATGQLAAIEDLSR